MSNIHPDEERELRSALIRTEGLGASQGGQGMGVAGEGLSRVEERKDYKEQGSH